MKTIILFFACLLSPVLCSQDGPNIVLIVADDLGYSDIGCYGGEIATPHLDRLAAEGLRFTQFYNNSKCTQTRAALLSGLYHHQTRNLARNNHVIIPEVLRTAGFRTLAVGKWHVARSPTERGFDRYFGFLNGAVNFWTGLPCGKNKKNQFRLDGEEYIAPKKGFYTTDAFTDRAMEFIDEAVSLKKPFFLYLAHNAPHYPLHAWPEDIDKYRDRYKGGWDAIRQERHARMIKLGVVDPQWKLSKRDPRVPAWESLSEEVKEEYALLMAVYAAMVDRLDQNIGRLMQKLESLGVDDNTLVIFFSDNGGCPYQNEEKPKSTPGGPESHRTYNTPWANASNTPFRLYKRHAHEGGVSTPMIARWPTGIKSRGKITREVGHLVDLLPTFIELADAKYPRRYGDHEVLPLEGHSLVPILRGQQRPQEDVFWEFMGHHAIRSGNYKLVAERGKPWRLHDIVKDRCEEHDLANAQPAAVKSLARKYEAWAQRVGAVTHERAVQSKPMGMKDYTKTLQRQSTLD